MSGVHTVENDGQSGHYQEFSGNMEKSENLTSFSSNDTQAVNVADEKKSGIICLGLLLVRVETIVSRRT